MNKKIHLSNIQIRTEWAVSIELANQAFRSGSILLEFSFFFFFFFFFVLFFVLFFSIKCVLSDLKSIYTHIYA